MSPAATVPDAVAASAGGVDRAIVLDLRFGFGDSHSRDMVEQLEEMAADIDQITDSESHGLATESRAARGLDQTLAGDLGQRRLGGETSSAGYLRDLGTRRRLPIAVERRLIEAARAGDRCAREELVEAFLPLIAGVARFYRGSETITRLELMREGVVGLLRGSERYDPALGVPF